MKAITRIIFLNDEGEKFFGEGPYRLLKAIEETGSLSAASKSMDMAYSKAYKLIKNAEEALGFALTEKTIGGKDGGGSKISQKGKEWMDKYEQYRNECVKLNSQLYNKYFSSKQ